jgi:hypothetical protein
MRANAPPSRQAIWGRATQSPASPVAARPRDRRAADQSNELAASHVFSQPEDRTLPQRCRKCRVVRHSKNCALMSQMGHECRSRDVRGTSALPPIPTVIADIPDRQLGANKRLMRCSNLTDHSISSSARMSRVGGTSMPSVFAVFMFITSSMRDDCSTGRSAALAPLRICPT